MLCYKTLYCCNLLCSFKFLFVDPNCVSEVEIVVVFNLFYVNLVLHDVELCVCVCMCVVEDKVL